MTGQTVSYTHLQDGIDEAENMSLLWQQNEGFIGKLALIYAGQAEMEDLKQEGYLALCEACLLYTSSCSDEVGQKIAKALGVDVTEIIETEE